MQNRFFNHDSSNSRILLGMVIVLAISVFGMTWLAIEESRSDSLNLLVQQGSSLTEALAQASESAIDSENFYDYLVARRFNEIIIQMSADNYSQTGQELNRLALTHDLEGIYLLDRDSGFIGGTGAILLVPEFIANEAESLLINPESNYTLLFDGGDGPGEARHYHIQLSNDLQRVIILAAPADYYARALRRTQIEFVAQRMALEEDVEYVVYQTVDSVIFSSRIELDLPAIGNDSFLVRSLNADTISSRLIGFQGDEILELVRPFKTTNYQFGLFRIGLSLKNYFAVTRGFNIQMIALGSVLFVSVLVVFLYLIGRRKRFTLTRQYEQIKSITDTVFDQMRTGLVVLDDSARIVMHNQAFAKLFDLSNSTSKLLKDVITDKSLCDELLDRDRDHEHEIKIGQPGNEKCLLVSGSEVELNSGGKPGRVLVLYDITDLKELEQKATRKERLSEMGDLAAGVAHEIRNPLNTISIAAQRLASEFKPDHDQDEYQQFTKQIRDETKRLNEIITRFLALTREPSGGKESLFNLTELVNSSASLFHSDAESSGISFECFADGDIQVNGNGNEFRQVLQNLYNNAKESVSDGGWIRLLVEKRDGRVEIIVEDNGPGVPVDLREKIFTPYFTTKDAGTGLGLPTVHKIISDMGGEISIEESDLGGAKFMIRL